MTSISFDLNTGQRYRVFAGKGNVLSEDGVTVVVSLLEGGPTVTIDFWTREDAVRFFRHCAVAAQECPAQKAGEFGTIMAEDVATSWEAISAADAV